MTSAGPTPRRRYDPLVEILRLGIEEIAAKRQVAEAARAERRRTLRLVAGGRRAA